MIEPAVAVGVDVGGSKVVLGIVHADGEISHEARIFTEQRRPDWVTEKIVEYAKKYGPELPVGVAAAGAPDRDGVLHFGAFIPWDGYPLRDHLAHELHVPVFVQNDVTVAAWGEYLLDPDRRSVVVLSAGTGVGGGAVSDGALIIGSGAAMEIGHLPVSNSTTLCGCGKVGCLETVASGSAVASRYHHRLNPTTNDIAAVISPATATATAIVAAATAGDEDAKAVLREAGEALGEAAALIALVLDPERILLTGGLMHGAAHLILDAARSSFVDRVALPNRSEETLQRSEAGVDPIVLGAGSLAAALADNEAPAHARPIGIGGKR